MRAGSLHRQTPAQANLMGWSLGTTIINFIQIPLGGTRAPQMERKIWKLLKSVKGLCSVLRMGLPLKVYTVILKNNEWKFLNVCFTHCPTIWSRGRRISIWSIVEDKVVLDTVSRIINADKVKADRDRSSSGSNDGPFAVSVVWVSAWIARAGEGAAVSIKSSTTACKETSAGRLTEQTGNHPLVRR